MKLRKKDETAMTATSSQNGSGVAVDDPPAPPRKRAPRSPQVDAVAPPAPTLTRPADWRPLGELLIAREAVSSAQLSEALLQQDASGKRIGTLLVELGALDELQLATVLADQLGLPVIDLRQDTPAPEAVALLPESVARAETCIPMMMTDETLVIAVAEPTQEILAALTQATGRDVTLVLAPAADIRRAIDNTYRALSAVARQVQAFEASDALRKAASRIDASSAGADDAPVVQVVNLLITQGLRDRSSDIHIEPQNERVRVRYRIDGALHDVLALPAQMGPAVVSRIKIMAGMNIVERRKPQDGQIAMDVEGRAVDIRVATTTTIWGEKVVMRLLDKSRPLYRLSDLGMPPATAATYSKLIKSPFGMMICAGPTGSGKTTTLYGSLGELNSPDRNITTIEDPVEYILPSINQIQINEQAGLTFAGGLRSILRQDPDIILVGEIRDTETARIAVQSALTGHFVLSSLHATDAVSALYRLLDMGVEPFLVSSSVTGVVGQRLLRRICYNCKEPYQPTGDELSFYKEVGGKVPARGFFHGLGCNFCNQTGYQDRIGVYELLRITDEMRQLIVANPSHDAMRELAMRQGMRTLRQEAVRLIGEEVTTIAEVIRSIYVLGA
ncbi:MAG: GspE/PulE family protein [Actinobacteria bacterium]|nr:GspE/PulE family protein [Actinomycetota bacterium]MCA1719585.1 GspE/PulE family protein [Actinomycetota bacterium]